MRWTISYQQEYDHFFVTTLGTFTVTDHRRMVEAITTHAQWRKHMPICFDHHQLDITSADFSAIFNAANTHQQHDDEIGTGKAAVVMAPGAAYGIGRQFQLITENKVSSIIRVFTDLDEGLAWLRDPAASGDDD